MTVSGLTMISASGQSFQSLERQTQKRRSRRRSFGRLSERLRTRSCCRRTRISAASDILEKDRDRKNRKNAEKMAIRVERSISDEGDGQENRIAASSAKCNGNKAGWSFYLGQPAERLFLDRILSHRRKTLIKQRNTPYAQCQNLDDHSLVLRHPVRRLACAQISRSDQSATFRQAH